MDRFDSAIGDGGGRDPGGDADRRTLARRAAAVSLVTLLLLTVVAAGAWWIVVTLNAAPASPAAAAELTTLDAKLTRVRDAIAPIAREFTSEPATGLIDVGAYRARIDETRRLVDSLNGLEVTDTDAQQVRDLIVTGGSEVLSGMDAALDALASDEASATEPAILQLDAGLSKLQDARELLDSLLGRSSVTRRPDRPAIPAAARMAGESGTKPNA